MGLFSAIQSVFIRGSAGDPLPGVWKTLEQNGTQLRRGQLVMIAAGPGTGKSAFTLAYAVRSKVPTLYFSADSDSYTQLSRLISIIKGWQLDQSKQTVLEADLDEIKQELDQLPIRFNFNASPTLDQIEDSIEAWNAMYEEFPHLIVIDNITNVRSDFGEGGDPFSGLEALMEFLNSIARDTGACVIGLHHVTGSYNDGNAPIPLGGVKGQLGRVPGLILTLHRSDDVFGPSTLNVSTVKNREGRSDATGNNFASLSFEGDHMQINDF